jgi:hypothetical protein
MKCPKCRQIAGIKMQDVDRKDHQPYVYAVLCDKCEEPLHFVIHDLHYSGSEITAKALQEIAKSIKGSK